MAIKPRIAFQSHLSRRVPLNRSPSDTGGYIALAKVLMVHHASGTADVMLVNTKEVITSDASNQGRFAARITSSSAHFDAVQMTSSGVIEPLQAGQLVILAFLEQLKSRPIILGSLHYTDDNSLNILPSMYPIDPTNSEYERKEGNKYLRVFPSQMYTKVDGIGGVEISHPSKTFLRADNDEYNIMTDAHGVYDHHNLSERDPQTGDVRAAMSSSDRYPLRMLFVHRSSYWDQYTTWTKFFLDSSGLFRVTRDNNDGKLSYTQTTAEGEYKVRRQIDSNVQEQGSNYTETVMGIDGSYTITRKDSSGETQVIIGADHTIQVLHRSGSYQTFDNSGNITLQSGSGGHVIINGTSF